MAQSSPEKIASSSVNSPGICLEVNPHTCLRLKIPGELLILNGEIASGYLELGHRFILHIGLGWFIREFLSGNAPYNSPVIDPEVGAPQADIFYYYKQALRQVTAINRATRLEEKKAKKEHRSINPENIEALTQKYLGQI
jgi:hypothetical protein